jgi:hypothetical protein
MLNTIEIAPVSLVIPHQNQFDRLHSLLLGIKDWHIKPAEVIIVDSSDSGVLTSNHLFKYFKSLTIIFSLIKLSKSFPGAARNAGVNVSKYKVIAFLDVGTSPTNMWLSDTYQKLEEHPDVLCVWGKTKYLTNRKIPRLIKYATYGENPLITLPGSIFKKEMYEITGKFIEYVRAGEDADWMDRAGLHKISELKANEVLSYTGLDNMTFNDVVKKWFRNYLNASQLPYLYAQKNLYKYSLLFLLLIIAFNWNWVIARWNQTNILYIPYIT